MLSSLRLSCLAVAIAAAIGAPATASAFEFQAHHHQPSDRDDAFRRGVMLPTGVRITPTAAPGASYQLLDPGLPSGVKAGYADSEALSPDGKTLLVLTSGYNYVVDANGKFLPQQSTQFIFVYDVSSGRAVRKQVLPVSNSFVGIAFSPDGNAFYVPGAGEDDVHVFERTNGMWAESGAPIPLGHKSGNGLSQKPLASGIAVTADGSRAVVVNEYNDSVSIINLATRSVVAEQDLRPGKSGGPSGVSGGQYPDAVAIVGNRTAYVSSELDRQVVVLDISGAKPAVIGRIDVPGNPNKMVLDHAQDRLYVASDNADVVSVIDTTTHRLLGTVGTLAPRSVMSAEQARYKGASPDGLALSPDDSTLYVTNRGTDSVAVISLRGRMPRVTGLIPTGWSPSDVRVSPDGRMLYVSNAKTDPGPNPGNCLGYETVPCPVPNSPVTFAPNQYILNLTGSALLSLPVPREDSLERLTRQVALNNRFDRVPSEADLRTMHWLRAHIHHVIYIVKENRTYDQVLGDLGKGNGDPSLAEFPWTTTPNQHALAAHFVDLDNFYDPGDVSGNGWPWSTSGRESDDGAKMLPPNYAGNGGGGSYDWEGDNRNVDVGLSGAARIAADPLAASLDPDTLPAASNVAAPDGPDPGEQQQGYLWNSALRAGLSVRNYGFMLDLTRYHLDGTPYASLAIPLDTNAAADQRTVAFPANPQLAGRTDPYFRGFDTRFPDFYREQEWEREFSGYVAHHDMPNLMLVRFMMDHTGSFSSAIDGDNTPETQVADNDYAVGRLVQAVAHSPYADSTLIFVVEDDAQDGPDHVDAHRSIAFVVGPYVRKDAVVHRHYTTVNMLRTITDVLGIDHLGQFDADAVPMAAVFDTSPANAAWSYTATASSLLAGTSLPLPAGTTFAAATKPTHAMAYWAALTKGFDFNEEDKVNAGVYNRVLWKGLMHGEAYPTVRDGQGAANASADKKS